MIAIATGATLSVTAVPLSAFGDESETDTEIEAEQENSYSGFNYACTGTASAAIA